MIVKQGRFYLRHNTLSEDAPIAIIFKVKAMKMMMTTTTTGAVDWYYVSTRGCYKAAVQLLDENFHFIFLHRLKKKYLWIFFPLSNLYFIKLIIQCFMLFIMYQGNCPLKIISYNFSFYRVFCMLVCFLNSVGVILPQIKFFSITLLLKMRMSVSQLASLTSFPSEDESHQTC